MQTLQEVCLLSLLYYSVFCCVVAIFPDFVMPVLSPNALLTFTLLWKVGIASKQLYVLVGVRNNKTGWIGGTIMRMMVEQ
jgi:hypothetical protein